MDQLTAEIPASGGATGRIVFATRPGHTLAEPQYQQVIARVLAGTRQQPDVVAVIDPATAKRSHRTVRSTCQWIRMPRPP
ncbi:MAG: hypothetical protein L0H79_07860 [Intrasporangium sp.]|uniref:hypothetical protein n=1 Tax=Intrasporangium sp. TaxID=1925024 RepID=UPI00264A0851|nr:hypothetical protein [Intrasporangium sp.]MDN5795654.1 hypothetical protein [Intrasporangium sp.]